MFSNANAPRAGARLAVLHAPLASPGGEGCALRSLGRSLCCPPGPVGNLIRLVVFWLTLCGGKVSHNTLRPPCPVGAKRLYGEPRKNYFIIGDGMKMF